MRYLLHENASLYTSVGCDRVLYRVLGKRLEDTRYGIADINGKILTPPCFEISSLGDPYFNDGLIKLSYKEKWGFLDASGRIAIPFVFSKCTSFENGKATAIYDDRLILEIDTKGIILSVRPKLEHEHVLENYETHQPSESLVVDDEYYFNRIGRSNPWRYFLCRNGQQELHFPLTHVSRRHDGWILCGLNKNPSSVSSEYYIYYDTESKSTSKMYESARPFCSGYAVADGQLIDANLRPILSELQEAHFIGSSFLAGVKNGKWGVVDIEGNVIIHFRYDNSVETLSNLDRFTQHLIVEMKSYDQSRGIARFSEFITSLNETTAYENTIQQSKVSRLTAKDVATHTGNKSGYTWTTSFLLCLFLGIYGAHLFYVKKYGKGLLYLCTVGLFVVGWAIDIFKLLNGTFQDDDGKFVSRH